jgi:hypothetical protein
MTEIDPQLSTLLAVADRDICIIEQEDTVATI